MPPLFALAEVAVPVADKAEELMAHADLGHGALQDVLAPAENVDAVAALLRTGEERLEQIDPGHALGQALPQEPRGPDDRLTVGGDEIRAGDGGTQRFVPLDAHEFRGVQRTVLKRPSFRHGRVDDVDGLVEGQRVDWAAEE